MRGFRRARRTGAVIIGAGALAAAMLPATGIAQPSTSDELPVDQWPATDIFYGEDGQPTISPEHPEQLQLPQ